MQGKILVVDDEESICVIFSAILSRAGYEVTTASDFASALTAVGAETFDVIFSDVYLGGRSGLDFLREVREQGVDSYVIMVTGFPGLETVQEALRAGAFDYMAKPVLSEQLLHMADQAMRHKRLRDDRERDRRNLEAIFRSVKDAIVTVDQNRILVACNHAAQRICGVTQNDVGHPFRPDERHCAGECRLALDRVFLERKPVEVEKQLCQPGHPHRPQKVALSATPLLDDAERFSGAVLVVRDETRLLALEEDLRERQQFHRIVGKSLEMQRLFTMIENLADLGTTVLINGESGTGKELVAEAIHYQGVRANGPLVKVNCSALPDSLLESELFGHVRGAFTGALRDKVGRFQLADRGTIFLDEIGDISPAMQVRLLRVLQHREFERLGDVRTIKVDVRVIAATHRDLREKILQGEFREDLYYRLKVVEVRIPSLRQRREDIPLLVHFMVRKFNGVYGRSIASVSDEVMRRFLNHDWPGNVRELEHVLEYAFVVCRGSQVTIDDLPAEMQDSYPVVVSSVTSPPEERERIIEALRQAGWAKSKAARLLGLSRSTLYRKMAQWGIMIPPEFVTPGASDPG